jgi:hypothetical protein
MPPLTAAAKRKLAAIDRALIFAGLTERYPPRTGPRPKRKQKDQGAT